MGLDSGYVQGIGEVIVVEIGNGILKEPGCSD